MGVVGVGIALDLAFLVHDAFLRGFIAGAAAAGMVGGVVVLTMQVTGTAPRSMGGSAEQFTAAELRRLRKHGWRLIKHLALRKWDIDHVLIGPGGVIAVETKWSARGWDLVAPNAELRGAVQRVIDSARDLRLMVGPRDSDLFKPAVFLWGGGNRDEVDVPRQPRQLAGVDVIYGSAASRAWRQMLTTNAPKAAFDAAEINRIWHDLDAHLRRRDAKDDAISPPPPPSPSRIVSSAVTILALGVFAFYLPMLEFSTVHNWWLWGGTIAAAAIGAYAVRWITGARLATTAALTGLAANVLLRAALAGLDRWG